MTDKNKETPGEATPGETDYSTWSIDEIAAEFRRTQQEINEHPSGWEPSAEQREALAWYGECRRRREARKVEMFYALAMLARTLFRAVFAGGGKPE
ncbi:hypothetical protein [Corynebacterium sp. HMSC076D02]|uniref:hypothetical protein n=1 Tax=Corynebacterium sp. HMSC076D02 TaxID=1739439 RepID=UPI0008A586BD|nr:hypothetical protein [Corynebacterium sp. HMSC076D02]OFQ47334.1 hypothetical protein HMPREF2935_02280 [Corynebacterium sp. HMSC076D02]